MKIVIASDSYKGSCSSLEVADSIEKGIKRVYPKANIVKLPVADGGEGTVDALVIGRGGNYEQAEVVGPLGRTIKAKYGMIDKDTGVIEMSSASGLTLIKDKERNPLITTTYGSGQLILSAVKKGAKNILIGLGGSATNDGGVGMAQALGISFKDDKGLEIGYGGGQLNKIKEIDTKGINPLLKGIKISIISDVANPLCGPNGASHIYGAQKGASPETIELLDENLRHYGEKIKEYLGKDIMDIRGAGAAGGLGGGLIAFLDGEVYSGIDKVLDILEIHRHLQDADLVITGEGQIDGQSVFGKLPIGVAKKAGEHNIPVIAIVGSEGEGASKVYCHNIDIIIDIINKPMTLAEAMKDVKPLIENAGEKAMRIMKLVDKYYFEKGL